MPETEIPEIVTKQEFYRSTEKFHVMACWVGMSLNLLWFISDYFVIPDYYIPFLIFRVSVCTISLLAVTFRHSLKISIYTCMFILVLGISIQNSYMWSVMDVSHFQKHTLAYIVLFIGVGMLVLWNFKLSLLLLVTSIISNIIFYKLNSHLSVDEFLIDGGLLTLTVAIFCVFLIRTRYRLTYNEIRSRLQLAKSKEIIEQKHTEVVNQKKEITDSINYARSIQRSLIPSEERFSKYFKDSFVLFKPKDIVSGDFYWIYEKENVLFYATGDCTGHGVPGGFMTVLGLTFLDEIVELKEIKNPALILDLIREKLITTLRQNGNFGENKDGMDITVCCLNKVTKEFSYASANNPFYIVRSSGALKELSVYKADKQPCGFYHDYKPFTAHSLFLEEGDCIYTFTDGFPDQFGGPNGKKFMHRQFKELLKKISGFDFPEQKKHLNEAFINWQGTLDQVDDVLVIGVKI